MNEIENALPFQKPKWIEIEFKHIKPIKQIIYYTFKMHAKYIHTQTSNSTFEICLSLLWDILIMIFMMVPNYVGPMNP